MQNVDDAGTAHALRVVHSGVREIRMIAELLRALSRKVQHVVLRTEMQAAGGTRLDARGFEPFAHAIGAKRAFENAVRLRIHLWYVKRAAGDAVTAADAIGLLEIHDAVGVLHDGAVGGTRREAARLGAMHALVLAHQPHQRTVFALMFVEENQVPVIPARLRHRLVGVVEDGFAKRQVVPLHAGHFAGFAANAGGGVNEFANGVFALRIFAWNAAGMSRNFLNA